MPKILSVIEEETATNYVTEIIDTPPGFLLRSGILIIAIAIALILFLVSFISYPDKIECTGLLDSEFPSIELLSATEGIIQNTYIDNNGELIKGDSILLIQNTADHDDVMLLDSILQHFHLDISMPESVELGSMQADYIALRQIKNERSLYVDNNLDLEKVRTITSEIEKLTLLNKSHEQRITLFEKEISIQNIDLERTQKLVLDGVATKKEEEKAESVMLQLQQKREGMQTEIIRNDIKINQLNLQRIQIRDERANELKRFQNEINKLVSRLKVGSKSWKNEYLMVSPADGTLIYNSNVFPNKHLLKNESIGYIVRHEKANKKVVKAQFNSQNMGKVEFGNRAIIKFEAYPHKEFGVIESEVDDISLIPLKDGKGESMYELIIPLQDTLITSYKKIIEFRPNASVEVVVILEEKSLLQRIFDQFLSLLKNG